MQLPRNSVGDAQIKRSAVGSSEIRNRSVRTADIARSARESLRGRQGPAGPAGPSGAAFRAAITSGGVKVLGNATNSSHQGGSNVYSVEFAQDVSKDASTRPCSRPCKRVLSSSNRRQAGITVASGGVNRVTVTTFGVDGAPVEAPFHVTASC